MSILMKKVRKYLWIVDIGVQGRDGGGVKAPFNQINKGKFG